MLLGIDPLIASLNAWHPDALFRLEHITVVLGPPSLCELSYLENSGVADSRREIW